MTGLPATYVGGRPVIIDTEFAYLSEATLVFRKKAANYHTFPNGYILLETNTSNGYMRRKCIPLFMEMHFLMDITLNFHLM